MKFYFLTLIALVSFSLVSCDDDNNGNEETGGVYLPDVIVNKSLEEGYDGIATLYFRYDAQNRLTYIIQAMGEATAEAGDTISFNYDSQGRLSYVVSADTAKFTYNGNKVFCISPSEDGFYRDTLELGSKGELLKLYNAEVMYTYGYDGKGNMDKYTVKDINGNVIHTTTLTYDDKNGLFKNIKTPSWFFIREQAFPLCFINNTLQEVNDSVADIFTLKYNDAGYPTSVEVSGSSKFLLTIDYLTIK